MRFKLIATGAILGTIAVAAPGVVRADLAPDPTAVIQEDATPVSAADVIAASKLPGADSVGVENLTGQSVTADGAESPQSGERIACWTWDPKAWNGTWPESRTTISHDYWCGAQTRHVITTLVVNPDHDRGPACNPMGDHNRGVSGGVGLSWIKHHESSDFLCYPGVSDTMWVEPSYNWSGGHAIEACYKHC